jgi:hypothetical protein
MAPRKADQERIAPALVAFINKRALSSRTVQEALHNPRWIRDIQGALFVPVIIEYLQLWPRGKHSNFMYKLTSLEARTNGRVKKENDFRFGAN